MEGEESTTAGAARKAMKSGNERQHEAPPITPIAGRTKKTVDFLRNVQAFFSSRAFVIFVTTSIAIRNAITTLNSERDKPKIGGIVIAILG